MAATPQSTPDLQEKLPETPSITSSDAANGIVKPGKVHKGRAFWLVIVSVMVTVFLSAIDLTAVSTALPTIASDLQMQSTFSWVGSAYAIASTAFMPWFGGMAMTFGRRPVLIAAILLFALGSALSGAAQNGSMMIAARSISGVGGGGILSLSEIIVVDLVPLHERGLYMGLLGLVWAIASVLGPPIGGGLGGANWRWLFYLNLPLCGIALILTAVFLNFKVPATTWREKLRQMDWANLIFIGGIVSLLVGLTQGGNAWAWSSYRTIICLVVGAVALPLWLFIEKNYVAVPTVPWAVVSNRTALSSEIAGFIHGLTFLLIIYYTPVWPQATKGSTPIQSGLLLGPIALSVAPAAIVTGVLVTITQRYKIYNAIGWALFTVGLGLMIMISSTFPVGQWCGYLIILGVGAGMLYTGPNFPIMASLDVELAAIASALLNFSRSFGQAVGIVIGGLVLSSKLNSDLPRAYTDMLPDGSQAAYASIPMIAGLDEPLRSEVRYVFGEALSLVMQVGCGIAGLGLLSVLLMKELPLHLVKDERYALKDGRNPETTMQEVETTVVRAAGNLPPGDATALA